MGDTPIILVNSFLKYTVDMPATAASGLASVAIPMAKAFGARVIRRITSLYDSNGRKKDVIPIEKYPDIPKASGIEKKTFRKTLFGKPIRESQLKKTKTRLNKWDMKKMYWK